MERVPLEEAVLEIQMGDRGKFTVSLCPPLDGTGEAPKMRWFPPADPYMAAYRDEKRGQLR
ncbi:MAG: hypothetical protein ACYTHN_24515 [Planctomycetota bacterium]|jgi:hypothetical protein